MKFGKMSIKSDSDPRRCVIEVDVNIGGEEDITFGITGVPSGIAAEMLVRWNTYQDLKDELNSLNRNHGDDAV